MHLPDLRGKTSVVTGSSSGLGAAFAKLLAARGSDLVITARRANNLEALAAELRQSNGVKVTVIALDLSERDAPERLFAATEGAGVAVHLLVNNAGAGLHQDFVDTPWEKIAQQIQLNVVSLTELTHRFTRAMVARGGGYLLNVASIGAYTPSPTYATYSAGKAFVRDMTEAVAYELRDSPVTVTCLCPGGTVTEFHQSAGHEIAPVFRATFLTAEECAEVGLRAVFGRKRNVISGFTNKASMFFLRFAPRGVMLWATALTMGRPKSPSGRLPEG